MSNHHWNDWAGGLTLVLQAIVYIPLLYILLMPWLCLALVKLGGFLSCRAFPVNGLDRVAGCFWACGPGSTVCCGS